MRKGSSKNPTPPQSRIKREDGKLETTLLTPPLSPHPLYPFYTCPTTMPALQPGSSPQNSTKASSPANKPEPSAQNERLQDLLPKKRGSPWWEDSQTQRRRQCPLVHYHPLCTTCKTLIPEYCILGDPLVEQKSINFSTLSQAVKRPANPCPCLQGYRLQTELKTHQMWKLWRDKQFARAAAERREKRQVRAQQLWGIQDQWTRMTNKGTTTQLSTPTSPTARSLTTHPTPKLRRDKTCTKLPYKSEGLMDLQSTGV